MIKKNANPFLPPVTLTQSHQPILYPDALKTMETWVEKVIQKQLAQQLWFLEHPPLYTSGITSNPQDCLHKFPFPIYQTGRGGKMTYHGPGQRVAYCVLDLKHYQQDVRRYVWLLEEWLILSLQQFSITAKRQEGRVGLWTAKPNGKEAKIAAIGVRMKKWVTSHGIALNVSPDLSHFGGIVPCGLQGFDVTSMQEKGVFVSMQEVDLVLSSSFEKVFTTKLQKS